MRLVSSFVQRRHAQPTKKSSDQGLVHARLCKHIGTRSTPHGVELIIPEVECHWRVKFRTSAINNVAPLGYG